MGRSVVCGSVRACNNPFPAPLRILRRLHRATEVLRSPVRLSIAEAGNRRFCRCSQMGDRWAAASRSNPGRRRRIGPGTDGLVVAVAPRRAVGGCHRRQAVLRVPRVPARCPACGTGASSEFHRLPSPRRLRPDRLPIRTRRHPTRTSKRSPSTSGRAPDQGEETA